MFNLINSIDTALRPTDGLHRLSLLAYPHLKMAWQVMTAEKTQRILQAIGFALFVVGTIVLVGMVQVGRTAWQEAAKVFWGQLDPIGDEYPEAPMITVCPSVDTEVEADIISPRRASEPYAR
jgi:hypothetical protein